MLANMKSGTKILSGFAVALLITLVVGWIGFWSAERIGDQLDSLANGRFPSAQALATMSEQQGRVGRAIATLQVRRMADMDVRRSLYADIDRGFAEIDEAQKAWDLIPHNEETQRLWNLVRPAMAEWKQAFTSAVSVQHQRDEFVASGKSLDSPEGMMIDNRGFEAWQAARKAFGPFDLALQTAIVQTRKNVEASKQEGHDAIAAAVKLILGAILLGALMMIGAGLFLSRSIAAVIRGLLGEAGKLTRAVEQGELTVRGDPNAVGLEFQPVIAGVNKTMDAFTKPIRVTAEYVDRISKGDLPPKITDTYEGDFNLIKENLNRCIDAVKALAEDATALSQAAVEGKLSTRADATKHQGDFRKIVAGVNDTLDAVLRPIGEAAEVLEALAQRDLRARVKGNYQGDHAKIKQSLNASADSLHEALAQVAQAVGQVSAASGQIASSSESVAAGASEQASSLEETSSSLESMSSTTKQAADNAQQANGLAQKATLAATEGATAMQQMSKAMEKIKASAEGTSQIIKDINEIAFQTNLLALNAAVEAARAGEAGRGFAVVAEEVRSLALRSKEAANKTEELIRQSVKEAGEGEVTARHVGEQLGAITTSVGKANDIVAEMAAAAREQVAAIEQISKAVSQVGQVTQQNAANSEESSSAAAELSGQSEELAAMVSTFKLEHSQLSLKAPAPAGKPALKSAPKAKLLPAKKNGKNGMTVRPEDVIPMENDPSFKEF